MLQHLLNTTAIWALSLLLFDLFLKRETFHAYNRVYLLLTFLLGLFLPFWSWHNNSFIYTTALHEPAQQIAMAKQAMVHKAALPKAIIDREMTLWFVYLIGVAISMVLLTSEAIKLSNLYRKGSKMHEGQWTVIETGETHAPFSIFKNVFVGSKAQYDASQWAIIMQHEQRHGALRHLVDLLFMQLAKAAFWFHPLVYVYYQRLLMVHEYQADATAPILPAQYGQFLIEQSMLSNAPAFSHSFNRSPIKNRIVMLTHKTSQYKHTAKLLILPMLVVFLACCTKSIFSPEGPTRVGNIATYNGNRFVIGIPRQPDTVWISLGNGPRSEKIVMQDSVPVTMNGKPIYAMIATDKLGSQIDKEKVADLGPIFTGPEKSLRVYLLKNLKDELGKLDDGAYTMNLNNVVVDENGNVVYFEYPGVEKCRASGPDAATSKQASPQIQMSGSYTLQQNPNGKYGPDAIKKSMQDEITRKLYAQIETAPRFIPARKGNTPVVSLINESLFKQNYFMVKNHQALKFDPAAGENIPL